MDQTAVSPNTTTMDAWGAGLCLAVCEACDHRFLIPAGAGGSPGDGAGDPVACPSCFTRTLTRLPEADIPVKPELVLPFQVRESTLRQAVENFAGGLWFPPGDLNPANLAGRLQRVFLPVWLVDGAVRAGWQAEAGFDYQVVSHQNRYNENGGGWSEKQVQETRIRWEPRQGRLDRSYQNVPAPALEQQHALFQRVGEYQFSAAQPYTSQALQGSLPRWAVGMPERSQEDAWPDALPVFKRAAAEECQRACAANHIRAFEWQPEFTRQNWTLLLLPLLTTYYLDDERKPQVVLLHGQTGRLSGVRRASSLRARQTALWLAGFGALFFVLSLLVSLFSVAAPLLLPLAVLGFVLAAALGLGALVPFIIVWSVNRDKR